MFGRGDTAPVDAAPDLETDLIPPQLNSQNYWGKPADEQPPMESADPSASGPGRSWTIDQADRYRRSHSKSIDTFGDQYNSDRRVLMVYTDEGPEILEDSQEPKESGKDEMSSIEEKDWRDVPESDTDNTDAVSTTPDSTSSFVREKRNKRPIRYRNKSKPRGRPTF